MGGRIRFGRTHRRDRDRYLPVVQGGDLGEDPGGAQPPHLDAAPSSCPPGSRSARRDTPVRHLRSRSRPARRCPRRRGIDIGHQGPAKGIEDHIPRQGEAAVGVPDRPRSGSDRTRRGGCRRPPSIGSSWADGRRRSDRPQRSHAAAATSESRSIDPGVHGAPGRNQEDSTSGPVHLGSELGDLRCRLRRIRVNSFSPGGCSVIRASLASSHD